MTRRVNGALSNAFSRCGRIGANALRRVEHDCQTKIAREREQVGIGEQGFGRQPQTLKTARDATQLLRASVVDVLSR